jgi:16S rRNA pseudouridine516 synthase
MGWLDLVVYFYLAVGLVYALWVWLFAGSSFFSIPVNTLFGPIYILGVFWHFFNWRKKRIHDLFKGKRAVIFDLDGTIVDDQPIWNQAIENVKTKAGLKVERNYPSGLNVLTKWQNLLRESKEAVNYSAEDLTRMTHEEFLRLYTEVEARPGFWALMQYLKDKGFKVGLASNTNRAIVDEILKRLEISPEAFAVIIGGDEVKHFKPHPEIYHRMIKELKVSTKSTVVFEDSITGAESAVSAGIDTIVIWDGEVSKIEYPRRVAFYIDDFDGLDEQIEKSPKQILAEEQNEQP